MAGFVSPVSEESELEAARTVIDALFEAFLAGDSKAMLDPTFDDVEVRVLGQV